MYRQYTQCYVHTPSDKPFNKSDLLGFVAGNAWPGGIIMILAFLSGAAIVGYIALAIQTAITITAVANAWLFHRLVCLPETACVLGTVLANPTTGDLGEFDNDQFFSIRPMPHPPLRPPRPMRKRRISPLMSCPTGSRVRKSWHRCRHRGTCHTPRQPRRSATRCIARRRGISGKP
jgi:hypothetical protein